MGQMRKLGGQIHSPAASGGVCAIPGIMEQQSRDPEQDRWEPW
jgi:hypothetical protein